MIVTYTNEVINRFWSKVDKSGDCWVWTASSRGHGVLYGAFSIDGTMYSAHRVAWEITFGSIENGMHVLHECDNGLCCRPDHLKIGTHQENMRDRDARGRRRNIYGPQKKGKLAPEQRAEIKSSHLSHADLARRLGVAPSTIQYHRKKVYAS